MLEDEEEMKQNASMHGVSNSPVSHINQNPAHSVFGQNGKWTAFIERFSTHRALKALYR